MTTVLNSIGLMGVEGYKVEVQVNAVPGQEAFSIVGLPDASIKESKDRVISAIYDNGCEMPDKKVIVNLSPAEHRKNGPLFDLAIAIGIMKEANHIHDVIPKDTAFLGQISLEGKIRPVNGILSAILAAKNESFKILYLPPLDDHIPLSQIEGIELRFVETLDDVIKSLSGQLSLSLPPRTPTPQKATHLNHPNYHKDFRHVLGHKRAKRALEISAAGGHNVLMSGPPGCGKSMLAETYPSILPELSVNSQFEVMSIYQLAGKKMELGCYPPFRAPHHSSSAVSLIGGGANPKPGEVTLAHHGVLFLDEIAEFSKRTLDMLRQPIESGSVTISRAATTVTYPAQFTLLAAMNPCPCGYLGSTHHYCTCTPNQVTSYQNRISGPIQDRFDILLDLLPVIFDKESEEQNEWSKTIRERVTEVRKIQRDRYQSEMTNATAPMNLILEGNPLTMEQKKLIQQWSGNRNWSNRVQVKIIRVARTISDLKVEEAISDESLWEAVTLRRTKHDNVKLQSVGVLSIPH